MGSGNMDKPPLELWADYLAGDDTAFNALFEMYHKDMTAFCRYLTRDQQDAEDLVQNLWLKLMTKKPKIDKNFKQLLFRMAKNLWYDRFRRGGEIYRRQNPVDIEDISASMSKNHKNPEADHKSNTDHIERIIRTCLTEREQLIWRLHCDEFRPMEIAYELSKQEPISEKTVKNLLSMIRKKLKKCVNNEGSNP